MTESAWKNVGAPIVNCKYLTSEILMCGGNPEDKRTYNLEIIT